MLFYIIYDGTDYSGWQVQPNGQTVQGTIQDVLQKINGERVEIVGCGRTDAGVHGRNYAFHVDLLTAKFADIDNLVDKLNRMLPNTISILSVESINPDFHARFDAKQRSYEYTLSTKKQIFGRYHSYYYTYEKALDVAKLNTLNTYYLEATDFSAFSKLHGGQMSSICRLTHCYWEQLDEHTYKFSIGANRFLRGMVRLIVGSCLNIHRQKLTEAELLAALQLQKPLPVMWSVPAKGLIFTGVTY